MYRIGYLTSFPIDSSLTKSFRQGLREIGYVEGRDVVIEARSAEQRHNDLEKLAAELVAAKVDVLVTAAGVAALTAKRVTATIPIVMAASADAVAQGIVASLARPGGNVTGLTQLSSVLTPKRLCPGSAISHASFGIVGRLPRDCIFNWNRWPTEQTRPGMRSLKHFASTFPTRS